MPQNENQQQAHYISTGVPADTITPASMTAPVTTTTPTDTTAPAFMTAQANVTAPAAELTSTELTSSQKIGWFFVGVLIGVAGILIASLTNIDKPYRSDCTKFAAIGMAIEVLFVLVMVYGWAAYYVYYMVSL